MPNNFLSPSKRDGMAVSGSTRGFSLVEILTVMAIATLLTAFALPAFNAIAGSQSLTQSASDMMESFQLARAYAMANNTYVFVGLAEVNRNPSAQSPSPGTGRVVLATVAAKDGSNNFDANGNWQANSTNNLLPVKKLQYFDNLHLADFSGLTSSSGPMASRQAIASSGSLAQVATNASFSWPLAANSPQFTFAKIVVFNPQGQASVEADSPQGDYQWLEVGLQPTHGNATPATVTNLSAGSLAAIQIDGVTGASRIFRP